MVRHRLAGVLFTGALLGLTTVAHGASSPPRGSYQCYQTKRTVSQIHGEVSYSTTFVGGFTLKAHGVYSVSFQDNFAGRWSFAGTTLRFRRGNFDNDATSWHLVGRYARTGVTMPNSQLSPATRFTVVLRDRRTNDNDTAPPANEHGDASYWYCRHSTSSTTPLKPVQQQPAPTTTTTTTTPPPTTSTTTTTTTTPPPAPSNASNVPTTSYSCRQTTKSPYNGSYATSFTQSFTLNADGSYVVSGARGSWSSADNQVTFTGGSYSSDASHFHLSGTYEPQGATMPNDQIHDSWVYTLVLKGSPGDADTAPPAQETDARSYWYCAVH